ncbi:MAG: adenosine deaminase [Legionella sp.]|nr:adenosine deaminase [Legionella sp.]
MIRLFLSFFLISWGALCVADVNETFESIKSDPNALYAFLKEMPKGGELHYHIAGGAYPETMLAVAATQNYCLNQQTLAMDLFEKECDGVKAGELSLHPSLYENTIRAWSMKNFIPGKESGHDHFFAAFYKFINLVADNHIPLIAEVMQRAASQNEQYMEIMIMPDKAKSTTIANLPVVPADYRALKQKLLANKAFVAEIDNTVTVAESLLPTVRQYLGCDKVPEKPGCQLTVRFQYHVLREQSLDKVFQQALHGFAAASRSHAIVGINLVQAEDGIISLRDYRQQMKIFEFMHQQYPDVHIALHAGELAPEDVLPENLRFHIHDAIKVGHAERIGHGVDIAFEDNAEELVSFMARHQIPVEINLVSNKKILSISGNKHPLRYYLTHKVPVVLSTDDEGLLRTDLTHQYVEAVMEHGVDYPALKRISRNALSYSFLPGKSLWMDTLNAIPVTVCKDLNSQECIKFSSQNEKAKLQRELELNLIKFEAPYDKPPILVT